MVFDQSWLHSLQRSNLANTWLIYSFLFTLSEMEGSEHPDMVQIPQTNTCNWSWDVHSKPKLKWVKKCQGFSMNCEVNFDQKPLYICFAIFLRVKLSWKGWQIHFNAEWYSLGINSAVHRGSICADCWLIYFFQLSFAIGISKSIHRIYLRYLHHMRMYRIFHHCWKTMYTEMSRWVNCWLNCSYETVKSVFLKKTLNICFATFLKSKLSPNPF